MASDTETAQDVICRLGRASTFLSGQERKGDLSRACEVAKETLYRGALKMVVASSNRPMLASKSSDGTPITIVHRNIARQPSGKVVHTSGMACKEFLVQNEFLRVREGHDSWKQRLHCPSPPH